MTMQNYLTCILLFMPLLGYQRKLQLKCPKVFDGYTKVKEARERLEKSSSIAKEESIYSRMSRKNCQGIERNGGKA